MKNGTEAVSGNAAKRRQLSFGNGDAKRIREFFSQTEEEIRERSMKVTN